MKAGYIRYASLGNSYTPGESNRLCVESTGSNHHKRSICFRDTTIESTGSYSRARETAIKIPKSRELKRRNSVDGGIIVREFATDPSAFILEKRVFSLDCVSL